MADNPARYTAKLILKVGSDLRTQQTFEKSIVIYADEKNWEASIYAMKVRCKELFRDWIASKSQQ